MAQHDYDIANAAGATVRSDLNNALSAIVSLNSGASAPSTTFAYMLWADTANGLLKQRNAANSAWLTLFALGKDYPAFPSGTLMLFQQTSAPTGWTKQTGNNDKSLRVVSGSASSGGATAFTSVFGSGKTTGGHSITQAELPNCGFTVSDPGHPHYQRMSKSGGNGAERARYRTDLTTASTDVLAASASGSNVADLTTESSATGVSVSSGGSGTAHSHTLSLDLQYVDVIIASKD